MSHLINWKILLIDDEEDIRQVISIVLSDAGYHVTTAQNGKKGIQLCHEISPQIVITDIKMPGMTGIQVLETLKKDNPDIEVIVLTAYGDTKQATRALALDASDFITKPISDEALFIAIKRAQSRVIAKKQLADLIPADNFNKKDNALYSTSLPEHLIKSSIDGALISDKNNIIIALNKTITQILGYKEHEITGIMNLNRILPETERIKINHELQHRNNGWTGRLSLFETIILDKEGGSIPVQISASLLTHDEKKSGMIFFFKDLRNQMILCDQWVELLDQLNIGAFTIDLGRRITSFNDSAQTMTGLKESIVLGKDCREIFSDIPCHINCPFHEGGKNSTAEMSVEITDQSHNKHLITRLSAPLYGSANKITGCMTVLQDHAALADLINRVNYKERSLKMILDHLDIGIFTVNRGGYTTFFNSAAEKISGYHRRQVLGRPCSVIFGNNRLQEQDLLKQSMKRGESLVNINTFITTPNEEIVPVRTDYIPLYNDHGNIVGCITTIQDMTLSHQFNQVVSNRYSFHSMIGKDPVMQKIFKTAEVVAKSDVTLLIEGVTGTGKDLLAKIIHSTSNRSKHPFVKINCAALPEGLLESELFGYIKGAFTGATRDKPGRFQEADQGSIFLDEIGDLPLSLQAKLLRVLEDQEFYPLGSRHTMKVDVRIISATNQRLEKLVEKRKFREDLLYRLNVMQIHLPPLKERPDDIPLIIRHILRKLCSTKGITSHEISKRTLTLLLNYDYPGNIRELQNILEHALIVCQGQIIEPEHLPLSLHHRFPNLITEKPLEEEIADSHLKMMYPGERETILKLLRSHKWHKSKTARALGVNRTTLWRKMKRLNINSQNE